mmetsp:Transcript_23845/g.36282  ORF Transcript_23845/g.36282 Transcript_23845/m.36282 type:complete len:587 (+) Transcript_23845:96-1856(+)
MKAASSSEDVDSDLQDLLEENNTKDASLSDNTSGSTNVSKLSNYYSGLSAQKSICFSIPELLAFYMTQFLINHPCIGKIFTFSFVGIILYTLLNLSTSGSNQSIGVIKYNFSSVKSDYDFDIGKVDHWCILGGDQCPCPDPLHPQPKMHKSWHKAVNRHKEYIGQMPNADVAILGQSVVEVMNGFVGGKDMTQSQAEDVQAMQGDYFEHVNHIFKKRFGVENDKLDLEEDEYVRGIAMGLTGDTFSNVLWRLMHGELPDSFDPPIWWLVLGMEDVARYGCSEEITVMGVLRIVEEIKKRRPNAKIVVNSLLPMMTMRQKADEEGPSQGEIKNVKMEFIDAENPVPHTKKDKQKWKNMKKEEGEDTDDEKRSRSLKRDIEKASIAKKQHNQERKRNHDIAKREKKYESQINHDEFNPILKIKEKFHAQRNRDKARQSVPVWTAVHTINNELHDFCKRTPKVTFFDATSFFAKKNENGDMVLMTDYISNRGHPTKAGFKVWLNAIAEQSLEWKKKMLKARENNFDWFDYFYGYTDNGDHEGEVEVEVEVEVNSEHEDADADADADADTDTDADADADADDGESSSNED